MEVKSYRVKILGCPVDNLSMAETISLVEKFIASGKPHQHVVINVNKLLKYRQNISFQKVISQCDIINADGISIVWASKLLGKPLKERVAGIDLMERLVELAASKKYRVFFLGAEEKIVKDVVGIYKQRFPQLLIVGYHSGYWQRGQEKDVVNMIKKSQADILFVAISSPKKELFLNKYRDFLAIPFVMGVGGAFDVLAGKTRRAPRILQKIGLEWLIRFIQEPHRLWRRYLVGNFIFISLLFKEIIKIRLLRK